MTPEPKPTAKALAEQAAKELAAAQAKSDLLERKSAEASAKFQAEAEGRRQTFMTKWLDEEFVQAHEADVAKLASLAAFETAVEEAVQKDPVLRAWFAYVRASYRIGADGGTATSFASQVPGVTAPVYYPTGVGPFFEAMQRSLERLATRLEGQRTAEIFERLDAAANGDDDAT
jgi:hypothetical protein